MFTGFLEGGKTRFMQETLEDERFNSGEKTLLLQCEEGIEELDPSRFPGGGKNILIQEIDSPEQINADYLNELAKKAKAERVLIEYNGMWNLNDLAQAMPENWIVYQEFMFADARCFLSYNANMRSLMVDKLMTAELIVLNRATPDLDKMEIHKVIRGVSRRVNIAYEYPDGRVEYDEIEDPLPFDVNADPIVIEDSDYALWYRDMSEEMEKYSGQDGALQGPHSQKRQNARQHVRGGPSRHDLLRAGHTVQRPGMQVAGRKQAEEPHLGHGDCKDRAALQQVLRAQGPGTKHNLSGARRKARAGGRNFLLMKYKINIPRRSRGIFIILFYCLYFPAFSLPTEPAPAWRGRAV